MAFILVDSTHTPRPKAMIKEAMPNVDCSYPDVCILNTQNDYSAILLNSTMLRQALLSDPERTKELIGVVVKDIHDVEEKKPEPKPKKQVVRHTTKVEVIQ